MTTLQRVELGVLGPVQVRQYGLPVAIPGAKPRAILTMLGLHDGSVVGADALLATGRAAEMIGELEAAIASQDVSLEILFRNRFRRASRQCTGSTTAALSSRSTCKERRTKDSISSGG
ncbi:MAG TPA: hypothetical protein VJR50_25960 [Mycobacterium sp.]|nr:hypothetical protein [Mycobacterium sp.]